LRTLLVDAPPRLLMLSVPLLLAGRGRKFLERIGFRRYEEAELTVQLDSDFILDGEAYRGGALRLAAGVPLEFVIP
jgi:hypothetical protein